MVLSLPALTSITEARVMAIGRWPQPVCASA
jgi:hypothetical protein